MSLTDTATVVLVAYLLGLVTGVFLMLISILFAYRDRGVKRGLGRVKLPGGVVVEDASTAVVIFLAGAIFFGGTLYWVVTRAVQPESEPSPPTTATSPERPQKIDDDLISASASSFHPPDRGLTYSPRNTLDGNRNSAWNAASDGVGERLHYEFARAFRITQIRLINGYAKDSATFGWNARLRAIRIVTDERTLPRTLASSMEWQTIRARFGVTGSVTIEIRSVYSGSRPELNDGALTEIEFWGTPA